MYRNRPQDGKKPTLTILKPSAAFSLLLHPNAFQLHWMTKPKWYHMVILDIKDKEKKKKFTNPPEFRVVYL